MEATCNHCNHWHQEDAPVQLPGQDFGVCDELTGQHAMNPEYVLPLVPEASRVDNTPSDFNMVTGAMFGCNHFSERKGWFK